MSESKSRITTLEGSEDYSIWKTRLKARIAKSKQGLDRLLIHGDDLVEIMTNEAVQKQQNQNRLSLRTTTGANPVESNSDLSDADSTGEEPVIQAEEITPVNELMEQAEKAVDKMNRKLYAEIIETVSDAIAKRLERRAENDGMMCIELLKKWFEGKDVTRVRRLKTELSELEAGKFDTFPDYMEGIMALQQQLEVLGKPSDEDQLKLNIEKEIRVNFTDYKDILVELGTDENCDLDLQDYVDRVEAHCIRIDALTRVKTKKKAIASQTREQRRGNNYNGSNYIECAKCGKGGHIESNCLMDHTCSNCGKKGHNSKSCWESTSAGKGKGTGRGGGKGGKGNRTRNPFTKGCYNCGEIGHQQWQCPKLNSKQLKKAYQAKLMEEENEAQSSTQLKKAYKAALKKEASQQDDTSSDSEDDNGGGYNDGTSSESEDLKPTRKTVRFGRAATIITVNESVVSKYLEQDDNLWSKDDVKRAMDKCKGRGPRELKVNLLQDGGSGEIIVPSIDYCSKITSILPDVKIQVANDQYTQVIATGLVDITLRVELLDPVTHKVLKTTKVTVEVEALVAPSIKTVLWSVDTALDTYGLRTIYDHEPHPRVLVHNGYFHKLIKEHGCRWMRATIQLHSLESSQLSKGRLQYGKATRSAKPTKIKITEPAKTKTTESLPTSDDPPTKQEKQHKMELREASEEKRGGSVKPIDYSIWHMRYGHLNPKILEETALAVDFMRIKNTPSNNKDDPCFSCSLAKQRQLKYPKGSEVLVNNNDVLSLDWIGPISPPAHITDNQCIMTFTIKKTRFRGAGFAQLRSEAPELLKAFIREHGAFKIIRMDNAKEFKSSQIQDICDNIEEFCVDNKVTFSLEEGQGTKVQLTCNYAHGQGGLHERTNGLLEEGMRSSLIESNEDLDQWERACNMHVKALNGASNKSIGKITPYEAQYGERFDASQLRVPFCASIVWVPHEVRKREGFKHLSARAELGMFVGYPPNHKGWSIQIIGPKGKPRIVDSRDVRFHEKITGRAAIKAIDPKNKEVAIKEFSQEYKTEQEATKEKISEVKQDVIKKVPKMLRELEDTADYKSNKTMNAMMVKLSDIDTLLEEKLSIACCMQGKMIDILDKPNEVSSVSSTLNYQSNFTMGNLGSGTSEDSITQVMAVIFSNIASTIELHDNNNTSTMDIIAKAHKTVAATNKMIPKSLKAALSGPDSDKWAKAIQKEIDNFMRLKVWKQVEWEPWMRVFNTMWTFDIKYNMDMTEKYKARLCLLGNKMVYGIDYDETHSPTVRVVSIRVLVTIYVVGLRMGLPMTADLMDFSAAYLNADTLKPYYFNDPVKGVVIIDGVRYVNEGLKCFYGGPDAGRGWDIKRDQVTLATPLGGDEGHGMKRCVSDACVYLCTQDSSLHLFHPKQRFMATGVHVDDNLCVTNDGGKSFETFKQHVIDSGIDVTTSKPKILLGMEWYEDKDCVILHMSSYISQALEEMGWTDIKTRDTPCDTDFRVYNGEDEVSISTAEHSIFRKGVGIGNWVTNALPTFAYTFASLGSKLHSPKQSDMIRLLNAFKCIKKYKNYGICFSKDKREGTDMILENYYDASHAAEQPSRRSVSGSRTTLANCLVDYSAKIIKMISNSPQESEYRSGCRSTCGVMALKHLLKELGIPQGAVVMWGDNKGVLSLCVNYIHSIHSRHIEIQVHYMRQMAMLKETDPKWCSGNVFIQKADLFTKPPKTKEEWRCFVEDNLRRVPTASLPT